jgi:hypothetical protein
VSLASPLAPVSERSRREPEQSAVLQLSATLPRAQSGGVDAAALERRDDLRSAAYLSAGLGALGVAVGTGFGLHALSRGDDCDVAPCVHETRRSARVAGVGLTLGLLGLGAGGVLYLWGESEPDGSGSALGGSSGGASRGGLGLAPFIGLSSAGVSGRF